MLTIFLLPGDLVCDAAGVPAPGDHRQVLCSFTLERPKLIIPSTGKRHLKVSLNEL